MQKHDMSVVTLGDIRTAIALLSRIPVKAEFDRSAKAAWAYPLAGIAVSLIAGLITMIGLWVGLSAPVAAALWIGATIVLTGAMHEDGLADCADGFWGGFEKPRRLEIMKDSQIGTYGVLALVLSIGLRWLLIAALIAADNWFWSLLAIETLSRAVMPSIMHALPHARSDGLSHAQGRPPLNSAAIAVAIGFVVALFCLGWVAFKIAVLLAVATAATAKLADIKIGGQTGDVLGASQQIAMIIALMTLA
ncbi:MAG: adenosylcobinamide-GDP ribazoletransferase [Pseudomonadota bacterium]|nr:adenosylcobinamide-GDP ribazoletransferase [Pseudomonadota bacterium]